MKSFLIRTVNLAAIAGTLFGYNQTLNIREKDETIARLESELETSQMALAAVEPAEAEAGYPDGSYEGTAEGFGGPITVAVTVEAGKLSKIDILSAEGEDGAYLTMGQEIIPAILDAQTADVDTISGATFSSTGIKNAVEQALEKAAE